VVIAFFRQQPRVWFISLFCDRDAGSPENPVRIDQKMDQKASEKGL
jgi:hypothetical protein